jgi:hypothetical protein
VSDQIAVWFGLSNNREKRVGSEQESGVRRGAREQKRCCGPCVQSPWQRGPSHIAYKSAQPPTIHNARAAGDAQHTQLGRSCALTENAAHRQRQSKSGTGRAARSLTHSPAKRPTHEAPAPVSCMHFSPPPPPTLSLSAGLFPKGESEFSIFFFALGFWLSGIERKAFISPGVSLCNERGSKEIPAG